MKISDLERKGLIREFKAGPNQTSSLLEIARRDISVARKLLEEDLDWAFNVAYNAILQTAKAWMLSNGYRPVGGSQHRTVVDFAMLTLREGFEEVELFDRMRKKRNRAVYGEAGIVSEFEAKSAVDSAVSFVEKVSRKITP